MSRYAHFWPASAPAAAPTYPMSPDAPAWEREAVADADADVAEEADTADSMDWTWAFNNYVLEHDPVFHAAHLESHVHPALFLHRSRRYGDVANALFKFVTIAAGDPLRARMQYYTANLTDAELTASLTVARQANSDRGRDDPRYRLVVSLLAGEQVRRAAGDPLRQAALRDAQNAHHANASAMISGGLGLGDTNLALSARIAAMLGADDDALAIQHYRALHPAQRYIDAIDRIRRTKPKATQIGAIFRDVLVRMSMHDGASDYTREREWSTVLRHLTPAEIAQSARYIARSDYHHPVQFGLGRVAIALNELRVERANLAASGLIQWLSQRHGFPADVSTLLSTYMTRTVNPNRAATHTHITSKPGKWEEEARERREAHKRKDTHDEEEHKESGDRKRN